ncbi:hypothetical protein [Megasphaera massiliensis]|uniref:hypothetical protein n=1 Tax=Megasphaera massiliensis TaxID=1232428 RepID=UPI0005CB5EA0|nr:hypothetical protein [Megasphaera massiliensis]
MQDGTMTAEVRSLQDAYRRIEELAKIVDSKLASSDIIELSAMTKTSIKGGFSMYLHINVPIGYKVITTYPACHCSGSEDAYVTDRIWDNAEKNIIFYVHNPSGASLSIGFSLYAVKQK